MGFTCGELLLSVDRKLSAIGLPFVRHNDDPGRGRIQRNKHHTKLEFGDAAGSAHSRDWQQLQPFRSES